MQWLYKILKSKLNPFGNYDNPYPPDWYKPNKSFWLRLINWYLRNPLHNFDYYWIGTGSYPCKWDVWHNKRNWNLILPFFSYRGKKWEVYIGWRPKGEGDYRQIFGFALRRRKQ